MNPVDEDRALDGEDLHADSVRGREAMDPTTRRLAWIAAGIFVLLAVLIGGWALGGRHSGEIPVIEAPADPVRVKPVNPGGMQALGASLPGAAEGGDTLAPPPEVPRPDALKAEVDAARRHDATSSPPASKLPAAPPLRAPPLGALPLGAAPLGAPPVTPMPHATLPAPPVTHPAPTPPTDDGTMIRTDASGDAGGGRTAPMVQLAALDSDAAARSEWGRLCRHHPDLFSGRQPVVEQAAHGGHAIWRLRTRGFATASAAASFCAHAHAERVACTVADF